jgi:hypothetical protein
MGEQMTDDEIKKIKEAEDADAWFQHRLREYHHTGRDPGGFVSQRPGNGRMIAWRSVPRAIATRE